jgi:hypothetical protein
VAKWAFDKRLIVYNWIGTINSRISNKNEWETANSIKWKSRTIYSGFWSQLKSKYYNPNIVGWNYLSNEVVFHIWFNYSLIHNSGFFRKTTLELHANQYDLFSHRGYFYYVHYITSDNYLYINPLLGIWNVIVNYSPASGQKFRYRDVANYEKKRIFEDAISEFVLIDDPAASWEVTLKTDYSKPFGIRVYYNNKRVRGSKADNVETEFYWRMGANSIFKYSLGYIDIAGSPYQEKYGQTIHRLHLEYNFTDRLNLRFIVQPNTINLPDISRYESKATTINAALSWEYAAGSFLYLVYNQFKDTRKTEFSPSRVFDNHQTVVLKINKTFSF